MGLGAAFLRVSVSQFSGLAAQVEQQLRTGSFNDVLAVLRAAPHRDFEGWDREGYRLPGILELLAFRYGAGDPLLCFLRSDATKTEWRAHLERLPASALALAYCSDVILLAPDEVKALRAAYARAQADEWRLIASNSFSASPELLPSLFESVEPDDLDVWIQEGDGERLWLTLDDFAAERSANQEPPSVARDKERATEEATEQRREAVAGVAFTVADAGVKTVGTLVFGAYLLLCAAIPLGAYPVLLPSMLRTGDFGATAFTLGLLALGGLLPLALVWKQLGRGGRWAVLAAHLGGLAVGLVRCAIGGDVR